MGWKNVKEHYRIRHDVQITSAGLCIGSQFIHNIIVIGLDGTFKKRYNTTRTTEDLCRYQLEMDADPEMLLKLLETPDTFDKSVIVYTFKNGEILEKLCEEPGWPNVTHDGEMMYENRFSVDKAEVVAMAKSYARSTVESYQDRVKELQSELERIQLILGQKEANLAKLETDYPSPATPEREAEENERTDIEAPGDRQKCSLETLLAQVDDANLHGEVLALSPLGKELL